MVLGVDPDFVSDLNTSTRNLKATNFSPHLGPSFTAQGWTNIKLYLLSWKEPLLNNTSSADTYVLVSSVLHEIWCLWKLACWFYACSAYSHVWHVLLCNVRWSCLRKVTYDVSALPTAFDSRILVEKSLSSIRYRIQMCGKSHCTMKRLIHDYMILAIYRCNRFNFNPYSWSPSSTAFSYFGSRKNFQTWMKVSRSRCLY